MPDQAVPEDGEKKALRREIEALKKERDVAILNSSKFEETIIAIHTLKEPGQYSDPNDTFNMVRDLYEDYRASDITIRELDKQVRELERYDYALGSGTPETNDPRPIDTVMDELRLAIDRAERSEKETTRQILLVHRRGETLHPMLGDCDDTESHVCSACFATKKLADSSERFMVELHDLRKIIRRSEVVMRRVAWNRKMQDPIEIKTTKEESIKVADEMEAFNKKPLA